MHLYLQEDATSRPYFRKCVGYISLDEWMLSIQAQCKSHHRVSFLFSLRNFPFSTHIFSFQMDWRGDRSFPFSHTGCYVSSFLASSPFSSTLGILRAAGTLHEAQQSLLSTELAVSKPSKPQLAS